VLWWALEIIRSQWHLTFRVTQCSNMQFIYKKSFRPEREIMLCVQCYQSFYSLYCIYRVILHLCMWRHCDGIKWFSQMKLTLLLNFCKLTKIMVISVYGRNFRQKNWSLRRLNKLLKKMAETSNERLNGAGQLWSVCCNDSTELVKQLTVKMKNIS